MKKKLPAFDIANELSGSSVFFTSKGTPEPTKPPSVPSEKEAATHQTVEPTTVVVEPRSHDTTPSSNHATAVSPNRSTKRPTNQRRVVIQNHQTTTPAVTNIDMSLDMLEEVRRVVKQLGKEAATHRFSMEEKRALADLVYTYHRQGYRTSENEITRIAVNWLLMDFKERGEQSLLSRMLELLHG